MRGACLLIDVRPPLAAGLGDRLAALGVDCLVVDSADPAIDVSYSISPDGALDDVAIGGIALDAHRVLGSYAETAPHLRPPRDPRLPLSFAEFARDEGRAALAALRALLPGCLNPPRNGALAGGLLSRPEQLALAARSAPDLVDPADFRDGEAAAFSRSPQGPTETVRPGARCTCLFAGERQRHFLWSGPEPQPIDASGAAFTRIRDAVARLAATFGLDVGEVWYRFDGAFRFVAISPHFGAGFPFAHHPAVIDDLARSLAHGR